MAKTFAFDRSFEWLHFTSLIFQPVNKPEAGVPTLSLFQWQIGPYSTMFMQPSGKRSLPTRRCLSL